MSQGIRIRVTKDGKAAIWEVMINDLIAYKFEGVVELIDFLASGTSAIRYVEHEMPERMRR